MTCSEHWWTFVDGSRTEYYITIARVSVKAKSYIILASTCTWVCRQGQPYVGGWVRFVSLRTNSAERPVNASLCYYKTNLAVILFFLNLVLNIYENPRRDKRIHSWIDGIVKVEYFHVFWFYGVINLNSRYRVQLFAFLSANKVVKYLLHFTLSGAVITENGHSMNYVGGH